ncbi:unnamed protein product, partial [marine sediment metagenome]
FALNDTATTEIYTLSLHDALPILGGYGVMGWYRVPAGVSAAMGRLWGGYGVAVGLWGG